MEKITSLLEKEKLTLFRKYIFEILVIILLIFSYRTNERFISYVQKDNTEMQKIIQENTLVLKTLTK